MFIFSYREVKLMRHICKTLVASLLILTATSVADAQDPSKRIKDITFDSIKFEMKKGTAWKREMLTPEIEKLENQSIRIRGYMLPSFKQNGITQFVLVRDNMECCFGPGAAIYDCVIVEMPGTTSASYTIRPIAVEGKFTVKPFKGPDGKHLAIYHLSGTAVKQ